MNWETVTSELGNKVYALWNNGRKLLTFAPSSDSNFVKIECGGEKRFFQIRYEGFRKNRIVMRNEYGVKIGRVITENKENMIELNDNKYFFSIDDNNGGNITIYEGSKEKPLAVCSMNTKPDNAMLRSLRKNTDQHSLLLALCWYLFASVTNNVTGEMIR